MLLAAVVSDWNPDVQVHGQGSGIEFRQINPGNESPHMIYATRDQAIAIVEVLKKYLKGADMPDGIGGKTGHRVYEATAGAAVGADELKQRVGESMFGKPDDWDGSVTAAAAFSGLELFADFLADKIADRVAAKMRGAESEAEN